MIAGASCMPRTWTTARPPDSPLAARSPGCVRSPKPISATGSFPRPPYLRAGGRFGIGTDSNVSIAAADELRQLEYSQRLRDRTRNVVGAADARSTGRVLFEGAVQGGARALGAAGAESPRVWQRISSRSSIQAPALAGRAGDALLDSLIFAGGRHHIDGVWRAGQKVVSPAGITRGTRWRRDTATTLQPPPGTGLTSARGHLLLRVTLSRFFAGVAAAALRAECEPLHRIFAVQDRRSGFCETQAGHTCRWNPCAPGGAWRPIRPCALSKSSRSISCSTCRSPRCPSAANRCSDAAASIYVITQEAIAPFGGHHASRGAAARAQSAGGARRQRAVRHQRTRLQQRHRQQTAGADRRPDGLHAAVLRGVLGPAGS